MTDEQRAEARIALSGIDAVQAALSRLPQDGILPADMVNRACTDGCENACSALYGAAWRVASGMGYTQLVTYILATEPGTSLKAAGWLCLGECGGGSWSRVNRPRVNDRHPLGIKVRWERRAGKPIELTWPDVNVDAQQLVLAAL